MFFSLTQTIRDSEVSSLFLVKIERCLLPAGVAVQLSAKPRLPRSPKPTRAQSRWRILTFHSISLGYRFPLWLSGFNLLSDMQPPSDAGVKLSPGYFSFLSHLVSRVWQGWPCLQTLSLLKQEFACFFYVIFLKNWKTKNKIFGMCNMALHYALYTRQYVFHKNIAINMQAEYM